MQNQIKQGFTLVELIVVITILAILATIGFLSLQGYSANARDGKRVSDIQLIGSSLELFQLNTGKYPEPTNPFEVTYSGSEVRKQGTFGETSFKNVEKLNKIPLDPSTNDEYTYSVLNTKGEYELGSIYESTNGLSSNLIYSETQAVGTKKALAMIKGNYNGIFAKVFSGSTTYVLAVPSIINSEIGNVDIIDLIQNKKMVYKGYKNLPSGYKNSDYNINGEEDEDFNIVNSGSILLYSGSTEDLKTENAQLAFISNLQNAYSGTHIRGQADIDNILKQDVIGGRGGALLISQVLIHDHINKEVEIKALALSNNNGGNVTGGIINDYDLGAEYTCAITSTLDLYCWGLNSSGQVGDGTRVNKLVPVFISSGVSSVSLGSTHTCFINTEGKLYCWGRNRGGKLGDGTTTDSLKPIAVLTGSGFTSISVGRNHTCAIENGGKLYCWGYNTNGELGIGTTSSITIPSNIKPGTLFSKVFAGEFNTCGITIGGELYCWGKNTYGQVGDGSLTIAKSPVNIDPGTNYSDISIGDSHTCGITTTGILKCWGLNGSGVLGDGTSNNSKLPVPIISGMKKVRLGNNSTCGLTIGGDLYCWGNNSYGQFGNGILEGSTSPIKIISGINDFNLGFRHICYSTDTGNLKCGGRNLYGQVGDGSVEYKVVLTKTLSFGGIKDVENSGRNNTCIITDNSDLKCWGRNTYGQLGDGTRYDKVTPTQIMSGVLKVSSGIYHTCALKINGELYCWGRNNYGQLGNNIITTIPNPTPILIKPGTSFSDISLGNNHTCAIENGGNLYCWGYNYSGQLGNQNNTTSSTPILIKPGTSFSSVSLGNQHTCGLTTGGELYCWGTEIQNGLNYSTSTPTLISFPFSFSKIDLGTGYSCGITTESDLYCFGGTTPTQILAGTKFSNVSLGDGSKCGITTGGELYCWGRNFYGQLGKGDIGTGTDSLIPVLVGNGISDVSTGTSHTCVVTTGGELKCTGNNSKGQLGENPFSVKSININ